MKNEEGEVIANHYWILGNSVRRHEKDIRIIVMDCSLDLLQKIATRNQY